MTTLRRKYGTAAEILKDVSDNSIKYILTINKIHTRESISPRQCRNYFGEILIITSELYNDYLYLRKYENYDSKLLQQSGDRPKSHVVTKVRPPRAYHEREETIERLKRLVLRDEFVPCNEWSCVNLLKEKKDYIDNLSFHLLDIYEEAKSLIGDVRGLISGRPGYKFGSILIQVEHVAFHASYCRHTLEILSHWSQWDDN